MANTRPPRGRLFRLCQKELRETLRDRRTIITLVLMPLLVYPVLSMTLNRFLLNATVTGEPEFVVAVPNTQEADWLMAVLSDPASQPPPAIVEAADNKIAKFRISTPNPGYTIDQALGDAMADVALTVRIDPLPMATVTGVQGNANSESARRILVERLTYYNTRVLADTLATNQIPAPPQIAIDVESVGESREQPLLATIIPLVLVLMTITGAVYPAIDLTAGERERGTMEALIASPAPRGAILIAKYVAVVSVALLTAVANLGAMFVTLWAGGLMTLLVGDEGGIPWIQFIQIFGLLVLFSGFFSAVLLALTSFARSFKEAQAYLIPVMLLSLTPGVLSLVPGVSLTPTLAIVPLLNIILLSREILAGTYAIIPSLAAILSTTAYAGAAIALAARLFGSDAVLRGSEISIGAAVQRPEVSRTRPAISEVAMTLALLIPTYFLASNILSQSAPENIASRLILNACVLILIFGGLPLLAVWYCKDRFRSTYRIARPSMLAILGAVVVGLGIWTWAHELFVAAQAIGIGELDRSKIAGVEAMLEQFRNISPLLVVATLALTPAVVEELCFRGYLFSALETRISPWKTVALTSLLFGLFHVLTGNVLLIERFLPTTMLGLILGTVAYRTGSVWPGIALHFTHNAFLELVMCYRDQLQQWGIGVSQQTHLPITWLAAGTALVVVGGTLIAVTGNRSIRT
jgi:ABC-2 type transport system permease protein/sodium transport system permease protein